MPKLSKTQQNKYRPVLLNILRQLGVKLERLEDSVLLGASDSGPDDGEDSSAEGYSRDFQLGLIENEEDILKSTNEALTRIENSEFGACLECEELIPPRRLEVVPYAAYCIGCQSLFEKGELEID
ncbi:MAG: TraR/DksA family transcriptional regulator [Planctomycetota bacterium]|nr:TraR/DksA family transcriptional regulator [Planctomycetota bacterium]MDA1112919.1 TraR/DksA family transcriptional regulator [Planctomycetota bacterium]